MPMPLPEIVCESRVESVVVYARGALVTRAVTLPASLPSDPLDLVVPGVTPLAEPGGVRAELEGGREVIALRARLHVPEAPTTTGTLVGRVRALEQERQALEAERARAIERRAELGAIAFGPESEARARRKLEPVARFGDALAAGELVGELTSALDARLRELDAALVRNERAREAAEVDVAQGLRDERIEGVQPTYQFLLRLARSGAEARALSITYAVPAARWWPVYAARLSQGASRVEFSLGALIAQASGEDWLGVRLALSTANLVHDARLPELPSLRLGRAQPPACTGYRAPPPGLDAMFAAFDLAAQRSPPPSRARRAATPADRQGVRSGVRQQPTGAFGASSGAVGFEQELGEVADDDVLSVVMPAQDGRQASAETRAGGFHAPPPVGAAGPAYFQPGMPSYPSAAVPAADGLTSSPGAYGGGMGPYGGGMPMPAQNVPYSSVAGFVPVPNAAMPEVSRAFGGTLRMSRNAARAGAYEGAYQGAAPQAAPAEPAPPAEIEPEEGWLDFDALTLGGGDCAQRGRLIRGGGQATARRAAKAREEIELMLAPPRVHDPLVARGAFDHRYDARGVADLPSDGRVHRVALATAEAEARPKLRVVPRESADVFREAEVKNPFDAPLLAGPVDVFVEGALIATAQIGAVDRGGLVALGLGVEDRVRVARNAQVEEATAWLPGSPATVEHLVTIDLTSSLGRATPIEIVERVPVSDDKSVKVVPLGQTPPAEAYDQAERGRPVRGGLRWRLELAPGAKQRVEFRYRITLPAKSEVVGGNRRE
jgi:uncharacterized protein DUF4139/uncharacterized protein DUF4140